MKKFFSLLSLIAVQLPAIAQTTYGVDAGPINTGITNTFVGYRSGYSNTSAWHNSFFGFESGLSNYSGYHNSFFGMQSGTKNVTGAFNTFIGSATGLYNTSGSRNTFIGYSGLSNTTGNSNTFVGSYAGAHNATGNYNTTLGDSANCYSNSSYATSIGSNSIVSANYALAMGYAANAGQTDAIAIGANANASAANATAIGSGAIANQANTVIIGNNANVGIGTSAPENSEGWGRSVDIQGAGSSKLLVSATTGSVYSGLWSHGTGYYGAPAGGTTGTWSNHPFSIITNKLSRMTVDVNGNVGIGTTTPTEKLTVSTSANNNGIRIKQTGSGFSGLRLDNQTAGGRDWGLLSLGNGNTQGAGNFLIYNYGGSGSSAFFIEGTTNNIGIGTISPGSYSSFPGSGTLTGTILPFTSGSYRLDVNGVTRAVAFVASSDERLKKNIEDIDDPLERILHTKGVKYNWRQGEIKDKKLDEMKQLGYLAQDLGKYIPEAVYNEKNGYYSINYNAIIPVLTEAVKIQQQQITEKDGKLEEMEQRLATMQSALEEMKQSIAQFGALTETTKGINTTDQPVLEQNTPNPFSSSTLIKYRLPAKVMDARILIFDTNGKQIKAIPLQGGEGSITINGSELMPGMYLYSLIANGKEIDTKRMILTDY